MSGTEQEEPDRVWKVTCSCGYSERFRWEEDARKVFMAHSSLDGHPQCGSSEMKAEHAYSKGGVDPELTLPIDFEAILERDWPDCIRCESENTTVQPDAEEWKCDDCGCQWTPDETLFSSDEMGQIPKDIIKMLTQTAQSLAPGNERPREGDHDV